MADNDLNGEDQSGSDSDDELKSYFQFIKTAGKATVGFIGYSLNSFPRVLLQFVDIPKRVRLELTTVPPEIQAMEDNPHNDYLKPPWRCLIYRIKGDDKFYDIRYFLYDPVKLVCMAEDIPEFRHGKRLHEDEFLPLAVLMAGALMPFRIATERFYAPREKKWGMSRHAHNFLICLWGCVDKETLSVIEQCLRHPIPYEECPWKKGIPYDEPNIKRPSLFVLDPDEEK